MKSDIEKQEPRVFTLPSGMKLVCRRIPSAVEYFGVAVNSGSRDEAPGSYGLAHFVEHTIFKGTGRRRSCHIINRMEAVGGDLNAFTSKEETNVYSVFPRGNLSRAVDLIADLLIDSRFPAAELDREREVVRDEIDSYLDTPSEAVFDDFEDMFFAGSQLGHNILGSDSSLDGFTSDMCRRYLTDNFWGKRMVAFYLGCEAPDKAFAKVARGFSDMRGEGAPLRRVAPETIEPFNLRRDTGTHQSHTIVGARVPGISSGNLDAIALITNILGGPGMNSRLNVALRERRGLVYSVEASTTLFSDCGEFNIYYGCDPDDRDRCLDLIFRELTKAASYPLSQRALAAAKKQFLGQLIVASESLEQGALTMGRQQLLRGHVRTACEIREAIGAITPDDILEAASLLRPGLCSVFSIG